MSNNLTGAGPFLGILPALLARHGFFALKGCAFWANIAALKMEEQKKSRAGLPPVQSPASLDAVWGEIRAEAERISETEPVLRGLVCDVILSRSNLFEAVAARLARKLGAHAMPADLIRGVILDAYEGSPEARDAVVRDIVAINGRDPACLSCFDPLMYYKGFQAICTHRAAHILWRKGKKHTALYLQSLESEIFAVDIHPAARFGAGILLDHATSFVAGETCRVDDDVSILHEVTLGGTGSETGDRHPKVCSGVLIGAGAKLIGNITIGEGAKIGAGSVVLDDVPPHTTVAGVPARPMGVSKEDTPSLIMNQKLDCRC